MTLDYPKIGKKTEEYDKTSFNTVSILSLLILIGGNITAQISPEVQGLTFVICLVATYKCWKFSFSILTLLSLIYFVAVLIFSYLFLNDINLSALARSAKIVPFLLLVNISPVKNLKEALIFNSEKPIYSRCFMSLLLVNFSLAYFIGLDIARANILIEFSIYTSYTIALLYFLEYRYLSILDKVLLIIFSLLCGSIVGFLLICFIEVLNTELTVKKLIFFTAGLTPIYFLLNFISEFRGREYSLVYLENSDRGQLFEASIQWLSENMNIFNWLFGYGTGRPLTGYGATFTDIGFSRWFLESFLDGEVYAYSLHNEFFRLIIDYGIIGLVLIILLLFKTCPKRLILVLGIGLLTNSYLFTLSGAVVLGFIAPLKKQLKKISTFDQYIKS